MQVYSIFNIATRGAITGISLQVRSHLPLFGKFSQTKSNKFKWNPCNCEFSVISVRSHRFATLTRRNLLVLKAMSVFAVLHTFTTNSTKKQ